MAVSPRARPAAAPMKVSGRERVNWGDTVATDRGRAELRLRVNRGDTGATDRCEPKLPMRIAGCGKIAACR